MDRCNADETQKLRLMKHLHCLMQNMNAFNLHLQMH